MEKMIATRMQFDAQKYGIMHSHQFGGTIQHSTADAGIQIVHDIKQMWKKGQDSTAVLLDVAQFFPSINQTLLAKILRKQGFHHTLCTYFEDYLVNRNTAFIFNNQTLPEQPFSVGVGQGSALSPILSGLYIAPAIHAASPLFHTIPLGTHTIQQPITPVKGETHANEVIQFFVDDGLILVGANLPPEETKADPQMQLCINTILIKHIYLSLLNQLHRLGLSAETDKLELMHFRQRRKKDTGWSTTEPLGPSLHIKGEQGEKLVIKAKTSMRYLGFYFDPKLSFREHIRFYTTKGMSVVATLSALGNSVRGLSPQDKRRIYISNVIPLMTYGAQLWWNPQWKGINWIKKELSKVQSRGARWITGAFKTTPVGALEIAAGLMPIHLAMNKLMHRAALRIKTLPNTHAIKWNMPPGSRGEDTAELLEFTLARYPHRTTKTRDADIPYLHAHNIIQYNVDEVFYVLDDENRPGDRLLDSHLTRITYEVGTAPSKGKNAKDKEKFEHWVNTQFKPTLERRLGEPLTTVLFTDGSQTNTRDALQRATPQNTKTGAAFKLICTNHLGKKTRADSGNAGCGFSTAFDAEMIALRMGLQSATTEEDNMPQKKIYAYVDNQSALRRIINTKMGPSQVESVRASICLRRWLDHDPECTVTFCWAPGHSGVKLNDEVNVMAKEASEKLEQPKFKSLAFSKWANTQRQLYTWRNMMHNTKYRGKGLPNGPRRNGTKPEFDQVRHTSTNWFLRPGKDILNGERHKATAKLVRLLTNHTPIGEFRERFNLEGPRICHACELKVPDTREHMVYECSG